jgi:hypothetical protein
VTHSTVELSWDAGDDGGAEIDSYIVSYKIQDQTLYKEVNADGTLTAFTLEGLKAETTYEIFVRSKNIVGQSQDSEKITITTVAAQAVKEEDSSSLLLIIIIVLVVVLLLVIIVGIILYCYCRNKNKKQVDTHVELNKRTDDEDPEASNINLLDESKKTPVTS